MMQNHTATQTPELAALPLRSVLKATRVNYKVTVEYPLSAQIAAGAAARKRARSSSTSSRVKFSDQNEVCFVVTHYPTPVQKSLRRRVRRWLTKKQYGYSRSPVIILPDDEEEDWPSESDSSDNDEIEWESEEYGSNEA